MVEWGGHHGGWGGFGPPSYIVKKCPEQTSCMLIPLYLVTIPGVTPREDPGLSRRSCLCSDRMP